MEEADDDSQEREQDETRRDWHRLFALAWADLLTDQPVTVEWEVDVARKAQKLDILLLRVEANPLTVRLPDGFEDLATHNLVTFKSIREPLDGEALDEMVGHYVNYRKIVSPRAKMLPEKDFRLFAVSSRSPEGIRHLLTKRLQAGVYLLKSFSKEIRVVVLRELPLEEQNAMMCLFSASLEQLSYGREMHDFRSREACTVLDQLFDLYERETEMRVDLKAFARETYRKMYERMTPDERERFFAELAPEQRLAGLAPEQRLAGLTPEEQLKALSPEAKEALLRQLEGAKPPAAAS